MKKFNQEQGSDLLQPELEENKEKYEQEKEIDTVDDFLAALKNNYDFIEETEIKKRVGHQILKIQIALNVAGLKANQVKVRETKSGVLGYYDPQNNEIAAAKALLEDFTADQQLFNTVLVHEKIHQQGIADEGAAQLVVKKMIASDKNIYPREQTDFKRTFFTEGADKALELYDIDSPEELINYYIEVEIETNWKKSLKDDFRREAQKRGSQKKALAVITDVQSEEFERSLEKGAPRLFDKLRDRNYSLKIKTKDIILKAIKQEKDFKNQDVAV